MKDNTSRIWKLWQKDKEYKDNLGYTKQWPVNVDFYEGKQWPQATPSTRSLPRPVLNIIEFICNNKKANVLSSNIKCIFKPVSYQKNINNYETEKNEEGIKAAELFTKFAEYTFNKIDMNELDNQAMNDATQIGTYVYHFFWNRDMYGHSNANYVGGLDCEIIDPLNIAVANPEEKNEQKQEWIIISSRERVEKCKEIAKNNGVDITELELIVGDSELNEYGIQRVENGEYCTVLTKYFRKDGEVFFEKSTEAVIIQKETPISPKFADESGYKMHLYPVVIGSYKNKKKSIYGIGEAEPLITTQRAINFTYALCLLAIQNIGFPKMTVKPNALRGQKVTNAPGEILVDYFKGAGNGISYMQPPSFSGFPLTVIEGIMANLRSFTGSTEVVTGETIGKSQMSGAAIATLQTQAKVPIELIQKQFWRARKKSAKICEEFFKAYYRDDREFTYTDDDGNTVTANFNGANYANIDFETVVDVGSATMYSEALSISLLDVMKANGDIDLDMYIELYPDNAMPFKTRLKQLLEKVKLPQEIEKAITEDSEIYQAVVALVVQAVAQKQVQQQVQQQVQTQL